MRKKRDKKEKKEGARHHLGWICWSFQWSLPVISVKFAGHFSEVCRSFQWSLSVISVKFVGHLDYFMAIKNTYLRIFLLFNNLIKCHEKREKSGREPFAGKKSQNKASKMSVYSTTTFLSMNRHTERKPPISQLLLCLLCYNAFNSQRMSAVTWSDESDYFILDNGHYDK